MEESVVVDSPAAVAAMQPATVEPQPAASVPSTSLPPSNPSPSESWLSRTDDTVAHLNRILSAPSSTDKLLLTINYTVTALVSLPTPTTSLPHLPHARLRALTALISDFRVFARLWGLLSIYAWARRTALSPPADATLRTIARAQIAACTAFQVLENAAYLAGKGVLKMAPERQARAWLWSARFWAAHVALDLGRLWRERALRAARRAERTARVRGTEGSEKELGAQIARAGAEERAEAEQEHGWRSELLVDLAYAPLTAHWSVPGGVLPAVWMGLLGSVAGVVGLGEAWKRTA